MRKGAPAVLLTVALVAAACADDGNDAAAPTTTTGPETTATVLGATTTPPETSATTTAPEATAPPTTAREVAGWTVQPGPEQVAVLGAEPGTELRLAGPQAGEATSGEVDDQGSLLFRDVEPGEWTIIDDTDLTTEPFTVPALDEVPDQALYEAQSLPAPGYGYLETRDGTTLSINVALPGPVENGPYPTVMEYSGYAPSDPGDSTFGQLFNALGYAYVGVNMRGSGCSGGSFDYFEPVQSLDGYDAIETIAAQPWVLGHRVGMVGISYPGISQLFVAAAQPPSLAAITPLSVIDDSALGVLYPGGILNTGFAVEWSQARVEETRPAGQAWAAERIDGGDSECADNQRLRLQNPDLVRTISEHPFWDEATAAPLAPRLFVDQIEVPVFMAGAWQDEQTGGRFPTMIPNFTGTDALYVSLVNGLHTESLGAGVFPRYAEFLDLYVAQRAPSLGPARSVAPVLSAAIFGTDQVTLPADRFEGLTYEDALAAFEAEPPIQVLFEEGAADGALGGAPLPRWVSSFDSWPVPGTIAAPYHFGADGALTAEAPTTGGQQSYTADPTTVPTTFFDDSTGSVWAHDVEWNWVQPPEGTAASFRSAPFTDDTAFIGSASADLWIRSSASDTDLEVTLSEIRPDGQEVYIQSGWLRASHRTIDQQASTELRPVQTHLESDAAPLPADEWTLVRVEILPFAHAVRAGSQLRVTVTAPGNERAEWAFATIAAGETVDVAWGADTPSRVVLPVVPGVDVPDPLPACTLRGQPCRPAP